jgi:phytoene dehydrogenase-like protein
LKSTSKYDVVVVGSGPNGMAAAITFAQEGLSVLVIESNERIGGGSRSAELTLPGYTHDVCSAVHPLAVSSPFFRAFPSERFGLEWAFPPASLAHPLDNEPAALLYPSLDETAEALGVDREAYQRTFKPLVQNWEKLSVDLLGALRIPRYPFMLARFGILALRSAQGFAKQRFQGNAARALFAGSAAHAMLPLDSFASASFGLVLTASAHAVGWPVAVGGSQKIIDAMEAYLIELGGEIQTDWHVNSLEEIPSSRAIMLDVAPNQVLSMAGEKLNGLYHKQMERYRFGSGVFKIDWALDGPIPWQDERILQSATVHIGGTIDEIARSEKLTWQGEPAEKPYVLLVQPSLFDPQRSPQDKHTAWAYCHVPSNSTIDMRTRIENQIERFAPGFRDRVLAAHTINAVEYQAYNANYVGGDINAGVQDLGQFFTRPVARWNPYSTPIKGVYICSASTPPGGGVHGMCGLLAAKSALKNEFR